MSIEKLKGSLLSEAKEDAQKIVETAQGHVQNMLADERGRVETAKKQADNDVEHMLEEQRNERIAWARLESKRVLAEAKEDAVKDALEHIYDELGRARKTITYKNFVKNAVSNAAGELGNNSIVIHVMKGEKALVPAIKGKTIKVVEDLDGTSNLGGALLETADGRMRIDMTIETLFETRKDDIRKQIYEKLFGGKEK